MYIVPAVPPRPVPVMATRREIIRQSGGQSPDLAGRIRDWLSAQFGPEWPGRDRPKPGGLSGGSPEGRSGGAKREREN